VANAWGIAEGEWSGAGTRARRTMWAGIGALALAFVLLAARQAVEAR